MNDVSAAFDENDFKFKATVTGVNLPLTNELELWIDGYSQTFLTSDGNTATFEITRMDSFTSTNVQVYTGEGYPENAEITHTISIDPALLDVQPTVGSAGGSKILVEGRGFAWSSSAPLSLFANGLDLCTSVELYDTDTNASDNIVTASYTKFWCNTKV